MGSRSLGLLWDKVTMYNVLNLLFVESLGLDLELVIFIVLSRNEGIIRGMFRAG